MTSLPPPQGAPDPHMKPPGDDAVRDNAPWWQGGILVALAAVTAATASTATIAAVTLALVPALALAAQLIGKWANRMLAWAVGAIWIGAVVTVWRHPAHPPAIGAPWVQWLAKLASSPLFLTIASLIAYCTLFGWERLGLRWRRTRRRTNQILDRQAKWHMAEGFSRFNIEVGLDPHKTEDRGIRKQARGVRWLLRTGALTTDQLKRLSHAVASYLEIDHGTVDASPTDNAAVTAIDINAVDTLATMKTWHPTPATDILRQIGMGLDYDLAPLTVTIGDQHAAIVGTTGSGKSTAMLLPMAAYAAAPNADLWIIDPVKHLEDYSSLEPHARVAATTHRQAVAALNQILVIADQRFAWKKANGINVFVPTPEMPRIGLFIDEAISVMAQGGKEVTDLLIRVVTTVRAAGINVWFGVQRPEGRVFDTTVRAQIQVWCVLQVDSPATTRMAFPGFPEMDCHRYLPKGYCALHFPGMGYPTTGRIWNIHRPTFDQFAARLAPPSPVTYSLNLVDAAIAADERESTRLASIGGSPQVGGQAVDLTDVDRLILSELAKADGSLRQTDIVAAQQGAKKVSKQAVSQRVKLLEERGMIVNDGGRLSLPVEVEA